MAVAALITWVITALGGFIMLGIWISKGGHRPGSGTRLAPWLIFSHFGLAVIGLILWIIYVVTDTTALAWVSFALLVLVALFGFTMVGRWLASRGARTAESSFPVLVVAGHGLFAVATLVLVLLTALGVGGS